MNTKRRQFWIAVVFMMVLYSGAALGFVVLSALLFSLPDGLRVAYTAGLQWGVAFFLLGAPFIGRAISAKIKSARAKPLTDLGQAAAASHAVESAKATKWLRGAAGLVLFGASVETWLAFRDVGATAIAGLMTGLGAIFAVAFIFVLPLLTSRKVQCWVSVLS